MSKELTVISNDLAVMPIMDLGLARERRNQIVGFVKSIMIENTDFGVIPGTDKSTLLKPGAEKLTTFFGLSKRFEIIERIEDWTGRDHSGELFFYYLYRCGLYRGEFLIAEADGSCSSFEAKYRWRDSKRICPNCQQPAIIKGKAEYGGGWVCFAKKGGCGAKFKDSDVKIEGQTIGRVPNPDVADQVNTIQKMAQKRALIAATLLAVNASEFFTQDLEDYIDTDYTVDPEPKKQPGATSKRPEPQAKTEPANGKQANGKPQVTNGDIPRRPQDLLDLVNRRVQVPYDSLPHLHNAIKQESGDDWAWPAYKDLDGWKAAYEAAYSHAVAKTQKATVEETTEQAELFDTGELDEAFPRGTGAAYQD